MRQFWIILSPNKQWCKIFFLFGSKNCDRGLTVIIVDYFPIWSKKERNNIIGRIISNRIGPMYIETPYIIINRVISSHIGPIYIKTPYIIIIRAISSYMGPIYIETPYIIISSVIINHMDLMYIKTHYIIISSVISSHMGPMYMGTPNIFLWHATEQLSWLIFFLKLYPSPLTIFFFQEM